MQSIIVFLVITLSIGYVLWRIYDTLHNGKDPCRDCEMKKNCKKFCQSKEK